MSFPLNVADGAMRDTQVGEPGSQSLAKHADACEKFDGMKTHTVHSFRVTVITAEAPTTT